MHGNETTKDERHKRQKTKTRQKIRPKKNKSQDKDKTRQDNVRQNNNYIQHTFKKITRASFFFGTTMATTQRKTIEVKDKRQRQDKK
jgi:hypothetical protein